VACVALEQRGLALESAPSRANVIVPGLTDTPMSDGLGADKVAFFAKMSASLPTRVPAQPEDIAQ
jgi:NAD(P)-dependent dehydrogenase (short-subunit alcohol dehydrogenase family)